jgi:L-fucose mutarotase
VLTAINPILTGSLLAHLDAMGHSDAVVLADAHFPAERLADRLPVFPALSTPDVLAAVRSVVPLDDAPALDLMTSADGSRLPVLISSVVKTGDDGQPQLIRTTVMDARDRRAYEREEREREGEGELPDRGRRRVDGVRVARAGLPQHVVRLRHERRLEPADEQERGVGENE